MIDEVFPGKVEVQGEAVQSSPRDGVWASGDSEVCDFLASLETSRPQRSWAVQMKVMEQTREDKRNSQRPYYSAVFPITVLE